MPKGPAHGPTDPNRPRCPHCSKPLTRELSEVYDHGQPPPKIGDVHEGRPILATYAQRPRYRRIVYPVWLGDYRGFPPFCSGSCAQHWARHEYARQQRRNRGRDPEP